MSSSKSLVPLRFSLVGPGRVGTSMAHWLVDRGAEPVSIAGRNRNRATSLAERIGATPAEVDLLETSGQDLLLLAVSDPALSGLATSLAARPQAAVVLHTAGALDASVLAPLQQAGSSTGSLHPLIAFPEVLTDPRAADGYVFAIDGDAEAEALSKRLADSWNGVSVRIPPRARLIYHLAASLSAGGVLTLLAVASEMATAMGLPREIDQGYLALAASAIEKARDSSDIPGAITGPVARGDFETFRQQVESLRRLDADLAKVVTELANLTLRFTSDQVESADTTEVPTKESES